MQALGATRLSRKTDESTSIERQTEQITLTAQIRGDTLVGITKDTDVSGSISPFEREDLGPWLTDAAKIAQWDVLIVSKLDRLTRSMGHFDYLIGWLDRNGKTLVSVSESLDLGSSTGRMFANLLAMFAQFERERIGERRREAGAKLRENGWWGGGQAPYGYSPVKVGTHWVLDVDLQQKAVIERMAAGIIHGKSRRQIGRELTADGVPTPKNTKDRKSEAWGERTITKILTSDTVVLDDDTRARVMEALDKTKTPWTKRGDAAMLLNVAYCSCGKPLYAQRWTHKPSGKLYEYYGCNDRCKSRIPMAELDASVDSMIDNDNPQNAYNKIHVYVESVTPGHSVKSEITTVERKMDTLDKDAEDYEEQLLALSRERKRLRNVGGTSDQHELADTGMTVRQYWATLATKEARRQFLLEAGWKMLNVTRRGWETDWMAVPDRWVIRSIAA